MDCISATENYYYKKDTLQFNSNGLFCIMYRSY